MIKVAASSPIHIRVIWSCGILTVDWKKWFKSLLYLCLQADIREQNTSYIFTLNLKLFSEDRVTIGQWVTAQCFLSDWIKWADSEIWFSGKQNPARLDGGSRFAGLGWFLKVVTALLWLCCHKVLLASFTAQLNASNLVFCLFCLHFYHVLLVN